MLLKAREQRTLLRLFALEDFFTFNFQLLHENAKVNILNY
jgi:hypothetical protein